MEKAQYKCNTLPMYPIYPILVSHQKSQSVKKVTPKYCKLTLELLDDSQWFYCVILIVTKRTDNVSLQFTHHAESHHMTCETKTTCYYWLEELLLLFMRLEPPPIFCALIITLFAAQYLPCIHACSQ